MFCDLPSPVLDQFESLGTRSKLAKRTVIFQEGDTCDAATIMCSGQVKLSCTSRGGKTHILRIALAGDVLGLGALVSGSRYELSAETIVPTVVKRIRRSEFMAFLEKYGPASMQAARHLSGEYKSALFDARRLALAASTSSRLAGVLLDWGRATVGSDAKEMRFTMALTHEELGSLAGTSRETVSRTLGRFQKDGLISIQGTSLHVISPHKLENVSY